LAQKPKIKAAYIKPLTPQDTGGAPFVKAKLAAKATGLGLSLTKRIGRIRKFGNGNYADVAAVNAYIADGTESARIGVTRDPQQNPASPNREHFPPSSPSQAGPPLRTFPPNWTPKVQENTTRNHCQPAELSRWQLQQTQDDPAEQKNS
jgi:hypothetical protein